MVVSHKQDPFLKTLAEEREEKVEKPTVKAGNVTMVTSKKPALPDPILSRYNDDGLLGVKPGMVKTDGKDIAVEDLHKAEEQKRLAAEAERRLAMNREDRNRTGAGTRFFNAFDAKMGKSHEEYMLKNFKINGTFTGTTTPNVSTTTGGPLTQTSIPTINAGPIKSNIPAINAGSAIILEPVTLLEKSRDRLLNENQMKEFGSAPLAAFISSLPIFMGGIIATVKNVPSLKSSTGAMCALAIAVATCATFYLVHKLVNKIYKKKEMAIKNLFNSMINIHGSLNTFESKDALNALQYDKDFRNEIADLVLSGSTSAEKIHNYITNGVVE